MLCGVAGTHGASRDRVPVVAVSATSLATASQILADPTGTMRLEDVMRPDAHFVPAAAFAPVREGNRSRVFWVRTRLERGTSDASWVLRSSYKTTQLDLYVPGKNGVHHRAGGFDLAGRDRALVPGILVLPESALAGDPIYLRIATVVDPREVRLAPLDSAVQTSLQRRGFVGFFIGFFVAIGVFNLLMYASLRDRALVNFAFVMLLSALRAAIAFGMFWQVLPPLDFLTRELIYDTVALATVAALAMFSIDFLKLGNRDRVATGLVAATTIGTLSIYITDFFPNATVAFDWTLLVTLAFYAALLYAGIRAYRRGMHPARIYAAGIVCSMLGYLINMSSYALPHQELWVYALELGEALQAILLAFAVAASVQESRAENERLLLESRQLEELAMRDGLTGVLNRRAFDAALHQAIAEAASSHASLGVLMIDIDHFKPYNDSLGHQAGDEALQAVARACGSCVRAGDIFARYGGEEFAAIVPGASDEELQAIAERMRASTVALGRLHPDGSPLTVSIGGWSTQPGVATTREQMVHQADASLYVAKASGRDRIVLGQDMVVRP